jgi:hypothetical protein
MFYTETRFFPFPPCSDNCCCPSFLLMCLNCYMLVNLTKAPPSKTKHPLNDVCVTEFVYPAVSNSEQMPKYDSMHFLTAIRLNTVKGHVIVIENLEVRRGDECWVASRNQSQTHSEMWNKISCHGICKLAEGISDRSWKLIDRPMGDGSGSGAGRVARCIQSLNFKTTLT